MKSVIPDQASACDPVKPAVLVVDDDYATRLSLKVILGEKYNVLEAESGAQALAMMGSSSAQVALLDIRLQDMTGTELLRQIKTRNPALEVIMITGYQDVDSARASMRLGACDYLPKPVDLTGVGTSVATALEKHRRGRTSTDERNELQELRKTVEHYA